MLRAFLLVCLAANLFASDSILISVIQPSASNFYGQSQLIPEISVSSQIELKSVTATFGSQVIPLTFLEVSGTWRATAPLNLGPAPSGTNHLLFTAIDAFNQIAQTNIDFLIDRPPTLHVSVLEGTLARPLVQVEATCEDDLSGCTVQIFNDDQLVFSGSGRASGTIDLSPFEGLIRPIRFFATDEPHRNASSQIRYVTSLSNPRFQPVDSVPGTVLDFNRDQILYSETSGPEFPIKLFDRHTGSIQLAATNAASYPPPRLTSTGVLFGVRDGAATRLIDLNRGEYLDLSKELSPDTDTAILNIAGHYALLAKRADIGPAVTLIRDLEARTNVIVPIAGNSTDLAEDGTAVIAADGKIYQIKAGQLRAIASKTNVLFQLPSTDGTNTAWLEFASFLPDNSPGALWAETPQGIVQLSSGFSNYDVLRNSYFRQIRPQIVKNGLIAFTRTGTQGQPQIWLRSPDGTEKQLTFHTQGSTLLALRDDGAAVVSVGYVLFGRIPGALTLIEPDKAPLTLGSDLAQAYSWNGPLQALIGRILFDVNFDPAAIGLSSPSFDSSNSGSLGFYVTATAPSSFEIQSSTNLSTWDTISTNAVTDTHPKRFEVRFGPSTGANACTYRLKMH